MGRWTWALSLILFSDFGATPPVAGAEGESAVLEIEPTKDFALAGMPIAEAWARTPSISLPVRKKGDVDLSTRVKVLYSEKGLYFLFECEDTKLTASKQADFEDLWTEDVIEIFLMPEEGFPAYFEYELSPLGFELPILVPNNKGNFLGWRPWKYEGERKVKKSVLVFGGERKNGAAIEGWIAEVFIPFELLKPLGNNPPKPGARWRANMYRLDYDGGKTAVWAWQPVGASFHEFQKFGTFLFK